MTGTTRAIVSKGVPPLLISGVFLLFLGDALFQIALPTVLVEGGGVSATAAGFMLSVGLGIGVLFVAPVAQLADGGSRSQVLRICCVPIALAGIFFVVVSGTNFEFWVWLVPIVIYGLVRTPTITVLLAYVTERGDGLLMQAANGIAQRGAVAFAALIIAAYAFFERGEGVFVALAIVFIVLAVLFVALHQRDLAEKPLRYRLERPIRRSMSLLRMRSLKASSALNASLVLVTILGNAFYPLGLIGEPPQTLAAWVLIFLVTRDLFGAVLAGSMFKSLYARVGIVGSLSITAVFFVTGWALLALPGREPAVILISAVLQGFACATGIGCTNLLAAHGGGGGERALRIGATQYLPAVVMLLAPTPLGLLFDYFSIQMVFLAGAVLCLGLMSYVLYQISPKRNSIVDDLAKGLTL